MTAPTKIWTKEEIAEKIRNDEEWLLRGLVAIFNKQTEDEKQVEDTRHHNDVGFTGADGRLMTSMAKFYLRNRYLSDNQKFLVRKRMTKYAKQLAKIANRKI